MGTKMPQSAIFGIAKRASRCGLGISVIKQKSTKNAYISRYVGSWNPQSATSLTFWAFFDKISTFEALFGCFYWQKTFIYALLAI